MSQLSVREIICQSRVVLDVQHPDHTGLTMRTIEVLGAGWKLVTTNPAVKDYDFYNPSNICVIDRNHPELLVHFF